MDENDKRIMEILKLDLWYEWSQGNQIPVNPWDFDEEYYLNIKNSEGEMPDRWEREAQETIKREWLKYEDEDIKNRFLENFGIDEEEMHEIDRTQLEKLKFQNEILKETQRYLDHQEKKMDMDDFNELFEDLRYMNLHQLEDRLNRIRGGATPFGSIEGLDEVINTLASAGHNKEEGEAIQNSTLGANKSSNFRLS